MYLSIQTLIQYKIIVAWMGSSAEIRLSNNLHATKIRKLKSTGIADYDSTDLWYAQSLFIYNVHFVSLLIRVVCKFSQVLLTHWPVVVAYHYHSVKVNIGSCNGLLPDATKPLSKPMLQM